MNFCKRSYQPILRYLYTEVIKRRGEIPLHKHFNDPPSATCSIPLKFSTVYLYDLFCMLKSSLPFSESSAEDQGQITEKISQRPKQTNLGGKTFTEWLAEKNLIQTSQNLEAHSKPNRCHTGKTFREWLRDKNKDKENEATLKENLAILELQRKAVLEEKRKLNPRVKTFEQWFEEKHAQSIIEFIQSKNSPNAAGILSSDTKYPEDASLVFDMWLTTKNMEDLKREERLYKEMVEKWRKKEQERLLVRRSILSKLSQTRKVK